MDKNIVYNFDGVGFATESGDELGHMRGNLAVGGNGLEGDERRYPLRVMYISGKIKKEIKDRLKAGDLGFDGEGFWLQSPLVEVTDNIAAGNHGAGFMFYGIGVSCPHNNFGLIGIRTNILKDKFGVQINSKIKRKWKKSKFSYKHHLVQDVPLQKFENNTSYANYMGLKVRYLQHDNIAVFGEDNADVDKHLEGWDENDAKIYKENYLGSIN